MSIFNLSKIYHFPILLLLLSVSVLKMDAQDLTHGVIKGIMVDEGRLPLPFASIFLKNTTDSTLYKATTSNEKGEFLFAEVKPGSYLIEFKIIGFESLSKDNVKVGISQNQLDLGVIQMSTAAKLLNAVSVTAKTLFIERQADKIVVNLNNGLNAGTSVMEVMDRLPGVQVAPDDQITLNGRGVQIYIDGKLTPLSAEALAGLLKGMSSQNIQKIELIAHPSSKYEAAGSGGIINIVKKRNHKEGLSGNVYGGAGQGKYGKQNGGLNLNLKNETYNLLLNSNYTFNKYFLDNSLITDFYSADQKPIRQSVAQINSLRRNRTFAPNLGADFYLSKKTTLSLSVVESVESFRKDAESFTTDFDAGFLKTGNAGFINLVETKTNNFSSGIHLLHQIDTSGREYTVDADYFRYGNKGLQNNTNSTYNAAGNFLNRSLTLFDQDRVFNAYAVKADYTHPIKGGGKLETGLKFSEVISANSNLLTDLTDISGSADEDRFRYTENINALYGIFSKNNRQFSYQLGLRVESTSGKGTQLQTDEKVDKNYVKIFPSAFLDYRLNDSYSLNLTFNKRIERPTYENLNPLIRILNANNYIQGNPELEPVIAYNGSVSYSYKNALSLAFHYTLSLHDFTTYSSAYGTTGITTTKPVNNQHTQYFALYLTYGKQVTKWWYTSSQASIRQQSFQGSVNGYPYNGPGIPAFYLDSYDSFGLANRFFLDVLYKYSGRNQQRTIITDPNSYVTAGLRKTFSKGSVSFNVSDIFNSFKNRYTQNSVLINQYWDNHYETRIYRLSFNYNFGGKIKKTSTTTGADNEKNRTNAREN